MDSVGARVCGLILMGTQEEMEEEKQEFPDRVFGVSLSASNEGYPKVRNHGEGPY